MYRVDTEQWMLHFDDNFFPFDVCNDKEVSYVKCTHHSTVSSVYQCVSMCILCVSVLSVPTVNLS